MKPMESAVSVAIACRIAIRMGSKEAITLAARARCLTLVNAIDAILQANAIAGASRHFQYVDTVYTYSYWLTGSI